MKSETIYDVIGIGIGPFNLGLAALAADLPELKCIFFDEKANFDWHPGLLLPNARLQVPFYADLVTLADPCSRFSYLAFLKSKRRLFRFAIHENNFATRLEYNSYCEWVVKQLDHLHFGMRCQAILYNESEECYEVSLLNIHTRNTFVFKGRRIVIGTGTQAMLPDCAKNIEHPFVFHSGNYLNFKDSILSKGSISIIGSGQSAAEIFNDLLPYSQTKDLKWFTRSPRFYPMEYSKLSLELTSPDYIDHFYDLPYETKAQTLKQQCVLYKGINFSLINEIYDQLYLLSLDEASNLPGLFTNCELKGINTSSRRLGMQLLHMETEERFETSTEAIILATGYSARIPDFISPIKEMINWKNGAYQLNRNYSIDNNNTLFVQNAELHTHGYNSADLGLGPYRNAVILNSILGYDHFVMEREVAFQTFGAGQQKKNNLPDCNGSGAVKKVWEAKENKIY